MVDVIHSINSLQPIIIKRTSSAIKKRIKEAGPLDNYEIVWKQLQDIAAKEIKEILGSNFLDSKITLARSKSAYPDIKLELAGNIYAIDIKSNESQKEPWFDMARLDTVIKKRIEPYAEEWELVIKYDSEKNEFEKAYFNLFREIVGFNPKCKGVKFRPYDGKLRPKSWGDFDTGKTYWSTKQEFLEGIRNSQVYRWKALVKQVLLPLLSRTEKTEFKKLFE